MGRGFKYHNLFPILFSSFTIIIISLTITPPSANAQSFKCTIPRKCNSIIDYKTPNTTTISRIAALFSLRPDNNLLGVNNLPISTPPNFSIKANSTIKIPFRCVCANDTGTSDGMPVYKVVPDDGLYHIAAEVFSGLVTFPQIQQANGIPDPNKILVGQKLKIPLPCSCDEVDGETVVHYGYLVASGQTVDGIAKEYNTTVQTLLQLNNLASAADLKASSVLDIPLKACKSSVMNTSLDYSVPVASGTYTLTARNCVMCNCDATNNFTLQCRPSQLKPSLWPSCPPMQCLGGDNLLIGNTTSSGCNRTTCAYAGFTNQTIFTTLDNDSTCPASGNNKSSAMKMSLRSWSWNLVLVSVHLALLSLHLIR